MIILFVVLVEAAKLSSYMHFREAFNLQKKTLLEKADLDKAIDFMDIIEEDVPKGNTFRLLACYQKNQMNCNLVHLKYECTLYMFSLTIC